MKGKSAIIHCPAVTFSQRKAVQTSSNVLIQWKYISNFHISSLLVVVLLCLSPQSFFFFSIFFWSAFLSSEGEDGHRSTAKPTELSWTLGTGHLDSGQWMVDSYKNVFINVFPTSGKTPPLRFAVWSFGQFDGFLLLQIKSPPIILSDSQIICSKHTIS